jgi:hypothetical protein
MWLAAEIIAFVLVAGALAYMIFLGVIAWWDDRHHPRHRHKR